MDWPIGFPLASPAKDKFGTAAKGASGEPKKTDKPTSGTSGNNHQSNSGWTSTNPANAAPKPTKK